MNADRPRRAAREFFDTNVIVHALAEAGDPKTARKREAARRTLVAAVRDQFLKLV